MSYSRTAMTWRRVTAAGVMLAGWATAFAFVFYMGPKRCRDLCSGGDVCQAVCIIEPLPWVYATGVALGVLVTGSAALWLRRSRRGASGVA